MHGLLAADCAEGERGVATDGFIRIAQAQHQVRNRGFASLPYSTETDGRLTANDRECRRAAVRAAISESLESGRQ